MFRNYILAPALAALLLIASSAQGALIDNGDTTIDSATGLEWLDLTLTVGESYTDIQAGFGGYVAQGYVHASLNQLCGLFGALGDTVPNCSSTANDTVDQISQSSADTLTSLLGITSGFASLSAGIFDSGLLPERVGLACIDASGGIGACFSNLDDPSVIARRSWQPVASSASSIGNWLVRPASVPEPFTCSLLVLGLAGLGYTRGRRGGSCRTNAANRC